MATFSKDRQMLWSGGPRRLVQPVSDRTPYVELSAMARVEAHRKNIYRPPYYVHKWWARRIGSVFRGITLDMLLPETENVMDAYYQAHDFSDIVVLDPFMGGGTTVGEALRLGCKVVGCDLNPVAWYLVSQAMRDVDVPRLTSAFQRVADEIAQPISDMYRTTCGGCGGTATTQYTAWVKRVPCGSCAQLADLNLSNVIMADMATKGAGLVDCPRCGNPWWVPKVSEQIECPGCSLRFVPAEKRTRNTHYRCDGCGHSDRILSALGDSKAPPSHRMRCLTVWCDCCGKRHQRPEANDIAKYDAIAQSAADRFDELRIPRQAIPAGFNTNQMRKYGYRYWHQMFNPRQLVGLDLLFSSVRKVEDTPARELLTLLASASLEFNSMFCGAKGLGTGAIRHVFAHHAFIPAKEPLEANLWGVHRSSGGYSTLFKERLLRGRSWADSPIERRFTGAKAEKVPMPGERLAGRPAENFEQLRADEADMLLLNQSSESLPQVPDGSVDVIITDPPFADSVMYSELSDYFYVWLRQALSPDYNDNFASPVVDDSREAVHNPGRGRDGAFYTKVLSNVYAEAARKLKPGGRMAFTFHHSGKDAWRHIEDALVFAGFVVERWWPVFAEMESAVPLHGKQNNGHLDIVFVCAKVDELRQPAKQDNVEQMGRNLSARVNLVAADYRALVEATKVQHATWVRAAPQRYVA
jgi:putative DNA methylase